MNALAKRLVFFLAAALPFAGLAGATVFRLDAEEIVRMEKEAREAREKGEANVVESWMPDYVAAECDADTSKFSDRDYADAVKETQASVKSGEMSAEAGAAQIAALQKCKQKRRNTSRAGLSRVDCRMLDVQIELTIEDMASEAYTLEERGQELAKFEDALRRCFERMMKECQDYSDPDTVKRIARRVQIAKTIRAASSRSKLEKSDPVMTWIDETLTGDLRPLFKPCEGTTLDFQKCTDRGFSWEACGQYLKDLQSIMDTLLPPKAFP